MLLIIILFRNVSLEYDYNPSRFRETWSCLIWKVEEGRKSLWMTFRPLPLHMIKQSIIHGWNPLGLKLLDGPLVMMRFCTLWNSPSDGKKVYVVNQKALESIKVQNQKFSVGYRYFNCLFIYQNHIGELGPESVAKFQAASTNYSIEGLFQVASERSFKLLDQTFVIQNVCTKCY